MTSHPLAFTVALFVAFCLLAGCATVPAPKSFTERIAAGYAGVAITNDTALVLVNAGTLSKADGAKVLEHTRTAREAIDVASTMQGAVGEDKLLSALNLLRTAQQMLCADKPTDPNCALLLQRAQP